MADEMTREQAQFLEDSLRTVATSMETLAAGLVEAAIDWRRSANEMAASFDLGTDHVVSHSVGSKGREHVIDGSSCWCVPVTEPVDGENRVRAFAREGGRSQWADKKDTFVDRGGVVRMKDEG